MYALVEEGVVTKISETLPKAFSNVSNFHFADKEMQVSYGWYEYTDASPPVTPFVDKYGDNPVDVIDDVAGTVVRTYPLIPLTPEEIESDRSESDLKIIKEATKDVVLILTELLPWLVQNTPMEATDFTPAVRQSYLDLKDIADRVRAREA